MDTATRRAGPRDLAASLRRLDGRLDSLMAEVERTTVGLSARSTPAELAAASGALDRLDEALDIAARVRALARGA